VLAERLRGLHDQLDGPAVNTLPAMALVLTELGQHGQVLQWCDRAEAHLAQHSPAWLGVVHNHRALCWVQLPGARATQAAPVGPVQRQGPRLVGGRAPPA
jgi:hypothetical protein